MSLSNQLLNLPLKLNFFFGNIAFLTLFIAVLLYWFDFLNSKQLSQKLKSFCMIGANFSLAFILILRWYESGHFPLSNLYESLIGLSWGFTTIHLILVLNPLAFFTLFVKKQAETNNNEIENFPGILKNQRTPEYEVAPRLGMDTNCLQSANSSRAFFFVSELAVGSNKSFPLPDNKLNNVTYFKTDTDKKEHVSSQPLSEAKDLIGVIIAPTALLTSVFANFFLPPEITRASALIPALKSNWLTMHVTVMVASYAFLLFGSLLSITFCVYQLSQLAKKNSLNYSINNQTLKNVNNKNSDVVLISTNINNLNFATWLNNTSYRILGLGFPLLTIGILSGAVWANEAWGSYWSWDPKETWALITWLVFAVYFHSRYTRSAESFIPAIIASVGFIVIWICYLGVNLLGTGLHSYGWFSN